jgi:hypothetical protein
MGRDPTFPHCVPNAFMMSPQPNHLFWLFVLEEILKVVHEKISYPEWTTGPVILYRAVQSWSRWMTRKKQSEKSTQFPELKLTQSYLPTLDWTLCGIQEIRLCSPLTLYPINWREKEHQEKYRKPLVAKSLKNPEEVVTDCQTWFPSSMAVTIWFHSWANVKLDFNLQKGEDNSSRK